MGGGLDLLEIMLTSALNVIEIELRLRLAKVITQC